MIRTLTIKKLKINFVLRHRFEKDLGFLEFRRWELGLWFRRQKAVGMHDFNDPKKWGYNLVGHYTFGINLLLCKFWISASYGAMSLDDNKKTCKCGKNKCNTK